MLWGEIKAYHIINNLYIINSKTLHNIINRYAITLWYFNADEREKAKIRFKNNGINLGIKFALHNRIILVII